MLFRGSGHLWTNVFHRIRGVVVKTSEGMAPDPGEYTVGCSFERLIPDERHKAVIRDAVTRVHKSTILATELLNVYIRHRLEDGGGTELERIFESNWLLSFYYAVTRGKPASVDSGVLWACRTYMPPFDPVDRKGLSQVFGYECINLAAVGRINVWMHFQRRVLAHVRLHFPMEDGLGGDERRRKRLALMQVADDLCRSPTRERRSPEVYHEWIERERVRLEIDAAVGDWGDKPLLWHLKVAPQRFLRVMHTMSKDREDSGGKAFALFPLRRNMVPRHIRLCQKALRDMLGLGASEYAKAQQKQKRRKVSETKWDDTGGSGVSEEGGATEPPKRKRRTKEELAEEKSALMSGVLDLRAARVRQRHRFAWSFTTDGVCARLNYVRETKTGRDKSRDTILPHRGIWAIDELKRRSRLEDLHVIGIDPGIREPVVAADGDDPRASVVRYTKRQREFETCKRLYEEEERRAKSPSVTEAEKDLSGFNSRSAHLGTFCAYCHKRHEVLDELILQYADAEYRRRRWKRDLKRQQSESRLYRRLESMHARDDPRMVVLAYGAWGATDAPSGVKKGNAPTIGVSMMRKLGKRFLVSPTPEHFTSKSCCKCLAQCGPWKEVETKMGHSIRGLRICQDETCKLPQNRDRTGALNISVQFKRLFEDKPPIRVMTDEEREFHRLNLACVACDSE